MEFHSILFSIYERVYNLHQSKNTSYSKWSQKKKEKQTKNVLNDILALSAIAYF